MSNGLIDIHLIVPPNYFLILRQRENLVQSCFTDLCVTVHLYRGSLLASCYLTCCTAAAQQQHRVCLVGGWLPTNYQVHSQLMLRLSWAVTINLQRCIEINSTFIYLRSEKPWYYNQLIQLILALNLVIMGNLFFLNGAKYGL